MATLEIPCKLVNMDSITFVDRLSNLLSLTNPFIGNFNVWVIDVDNAADHGAYFRVMVPDTYVGTPKVRVTGIMQGTPGAAETMALFVQGTTEAKLDTVDVAESTADAGATEVIGSSGSGYVLKDRVSYDITLSNLVPVAGQLINFKLSVDASASDAVVQLLVELVEFIYDDA